MTPTTVSTTPGNTMRHRARTAVAERHQAEDCEERAIFGCPSGDQRDLDFARKYDLKFAPVILPPGENAAKAPVRSGQVAQSRTRPTGARPISG